MFGFNKNKRLIEGPVEFEAVVEIDRPASEVFPLVDLSDQKFTHIQRGHSVELIDPASKGYALRIPEMEDVTFRLRVLDRVEDKRHAFECVMEPRINALVKSTETHDIASLGENSCQVTLTTAAQFDDSLSDDEVAQEIAVMSAAVQGDLIKLKVLAEEGLDAVVAMEAEDELGFDLDLGDFEIEWDDIEPEQ